MIKRYWEPGTILYKYALCRGKFSIQEGVVTLNDRHNYSFVKFDNRHDREPRPAEIGLVQDGGSLYVWMTERNDDVAIPKLLDALDKKVENLENQLSKLIVQRNDLKKRIEP